jgi:integrating conjugative element protein (TIGR03755 family)
MESTRSAGLTTKLWGAAVLLVTAVTSTSAQTVIDPNGVRSSGGVIDDRVFYQIGGGRAVSMSNAPKMSSIGVGIGWNTNLICGDMSLKTTLHNQLNGITDGFRAIMSDIIQNATAAVASLPALIIQRADPGLYNLLTNGILQARLDFDRSKLTCREMANRMADFAVGPAWDRMTEGMALKDAVASNDAVSAVQAAETNRGNNGVPWVGGKAAGGAQQEPIRLVSDVTRAGYNLLNGRAVDSAAPIDAAACNDRLTCQSWRSPGDASAWAVRVMGEHEVRTCADCTKTQTTAGVGLTPLIQESYDTKLQALQGLVTGNQAVTVENLNNAGSNSVPITRGIVEALRDEPDQDLMAKRLASEAAFSDVLEKALLLQRLLIAGRKEPNVAANQLAQDAAAHEGELLEQEINNLKTELELRRELAANSPAAIIQRQAGRDEASRGVFQGDTDRDRLDRIQKRPDQRN